MAGLCEDGNEPPGSLKASKYHRNQLEDSRLACIITRQSGNRFCQIRSIGPSCATYRREEKEMFSEYKEVD
ncbi:hypothetical protein ANN_25929 [Periplaneta americana]|uniref:Uncharacterized protein n=1 Tax=Periplaneta americana TaxID=6978 RepID=A0ABQ8S4Q9_PERAM|nr:hypothetical protein ANN_25929 [Periplaneta americana]